MFPPRFDYRRAESVDEAIDLLAEHEDAELLAGGHSLIPDVKNGDAAPGLVVDIEGLDAIEGVDVGRDATRVGALTTDAALLDADGLDRAGPSLLEAASKLGDKQIRNRGTVGGNLAYADPGADLPAAAIAADATMELRGPDGEREIAAEEFFLGETETAVGSGELLTAVRVPRRDEAGAYVKKTHPATGYALVGVAAQVDQEGGAIRDVRVAATGALDHAVRLDAVEEELIGTPGTRGDRTRASERATEGIPDGAFRSDPHASGDFRAHLLSVYVEEALSVAVDRATRDSER